MTRGFRDEDKRRDDEDDIATFEDVMGLRWSASGLALLCRIDGKEVWIPDSCITDDSEVYGPKHTGKLVLKGSFARDKGLIDG